MLNARSLLLVGSISGFLAVGLGALGSHGLEHVLTEKSLKTWHTAVEYHFYHTFAMLISALLALGQAHKTLFNTAGVSFLAGIIVFSGSLYAYTTTGIKAFAMITPIGGFLFMIGWILFFIAVLRMDRTEKST